MASNILHWHRYMVGSALEYVWGLTKPSFCLQTVFSKFEVVQKQFEGRGFSRTASNILHWHRYMVGSALEYVGGLTKPSFCLFFPSLKLSRSSFKGGASPEQPLKSSTDINTWWEVHQNMFGALPSPHFAFRLFFSSLKLSRSSLKGGASPEQRLKSSTDINTWWEVHQNMLGALPSPHFAFRVFFFFQV